MIFDKLLSKKHEGSGKVSKQDLPKAVAVLFLAAIVASAGLSLGLTTCSNARDQAVTSTWR